MYEHSASVTSAVLKRHLRHEHVGRLALGAKNIRALLQQAALRPTRQRMALAELLFTADHRHVTAGTLGREADAAGIRVSFATVYNTLNQFADAGLLRRVTVSGDLTYFDTNAGEHHHFYIEAENRIIDVPEGSIEIGHPEPPDGYVITRIDAVIRLRPIGKASCGACAADAGDACSACAPPNAQPRHPE
ncbi:MAG: Fur family transcriptional regulator [Pseudomonadota bacterium]|nr:transcriptional repressor [Afipia sp.]